MIFVALFIAVSFGFVAGWALRSRNVFKPETCGDCACGLCGSPKCRSCGRGLLFGHLAGTPFCSRECSEAGPKAETWAEFVARTSE